MIVAMPIVDAVANYHSSSGCTQPPTIKSLCDTMMELTTEDLLVSHGFWVVLDEMDFVVIPGFHVYAEYVLGDAKSMTVSYAFHGEATLNEAHLLRVSPIFNLTISCCCHAALKRVEATFLFGFDLFKRMVGWSSGEIKEEGDDDSDEEDMPEMNTEVDYDVLGEGAAPAVDDERIEELADLEAVVIDELDAPDKSIEELADVEAVVIEDLDAADKSIEELADVEAVVIDDIDDVPEVTNAESATTPSRAGAPRPSTPLSTPKSWGSMADVPKSKAPMPLSTPKSWGRDDDVLKEVLALDGTKQNSPGKRVVF
jgi:hypothetical protein